VWFRCALIKEKENTTTYPLWNAKLQVESCVFTFWAGNVYFTRVRQEDTNWRASFW
jgi:hypothetical protein